MLARDVSHAAAPRFVRVQLIRNARGDHALAPVVNEFPFFPVGSADEAVPLPDELTRGFLGESNIVFRLFLVNERFLFHRINVRKIIRPGILLFQIERRNIFIPVRICIGFIPSHILAPSQNITAILLQDLKKKEETRDFFIL